MMAKKYVAKGSVVIGSTQYKKGQVITETIKNQDAIAKVLALKNSPIKELNPNVSSQKTPEK